MISSGIYINVVRVNSLWKYLRKIYQVN